MEKIYFIVSSKYRKFKTPKRSYNFEKNISFFYYL